LTGACDELTACCGWVVEPNYVIINTEGERGYRELLTCVRRER